MSLLWPDTLHAGLFPGHCWLKQPGSKRPALATYGEALQAADLHDGFDACLTKAGAALKKGAKLSLAVSDGIAAITPLPWQENLESDTERHGYARICFEKIGIKIDQQWVMHVEFRRYGAAGLAYALPSNWLEALLARTQEKKLQLARVLPVSALAYARTPPVRAGLSLLILQEMQQVSAMVWRSGMLLGRDVEPVAQSAEQACFRLCARINDAFASKEAGFAHLAHWSHKAMDAPKAVFDQVFPSIPFTSLTYDAWP